MTSMVDMTDDEKRKWTEDFDNIAIEIKEKYGVNGGKIDISRMTNEDLKRVFKVVGKFPMVNMNIAPFTKDFIIGIIWEMNNRNI